MPGNISDVKLVKNLLKDIDFLPLRKLSFVMSIEAIQIYRNKDLIETSFFTMQSLLDELDVIEIYQQPGDGNHLSKMTVKQVGLYIAMDVGIPAA